MATIKRTTTTITPTRTLPPLPQGGLGARGPEPQPEPDDLPEIEHPIEEAADQDVTVVTVGQEQLQRSQEMQAMGIHAWVAAHDERDPDQQPQQVAGVTPLER